MRDFALVTEGVTDHAVLKNILLGFFKSQREPTINRVHPDPQSPDGGWTLTLHYLRNKEFQKAFRFNQYLIIHVDTDVSENKGFDVPHQDENGTLPTQVLVERVIDRLKGEIGEKDLEDYQGRFIFAIAVHQIECWMLPLWYSEAAAEKITGCLNKLGESQDLRQKLKLGKLPWIREEEKNYLSYVEASKGYRKPKALLDEGPKNPSLALFLDALSKLPLLPNADD